MQRGIYINMQPFVISYDTTIPREVGLSGSSSIIIATLRALMKFYSIPVGLERDIERRRRCSRRWSRLSGR